MKKLTSRLVFGIIPALLAGLAVGCAGDDGSQVSDLTSNTADARKLTFEGYVYVEPGTSDAEILDIVHDQTQTMFGPLRNAEIGVNKRELEGVDPATFKKTDVLVIDTSVAGDAGRPMVRVRYRYDDTALVPKSMSRRSAISLALMNPDYGSQIDRIMTECTSNDSHAQEMRSEIWYVFDPSLTRCKTAMTNEQKAIDADSEKLSDVTTQVPLSEVDRLYIPTTVKLGANISNRKTAYPEYHRLYTGGVEPGKLVIGLVNGFIDHEDSSSSPEKDYGFDEWLTEMREAMDGGATFKVTNVDPPTDLSTFTANNKTVTDATFYDIMAWALDSDLPQGFTYSDRAALLAAVGQKLTWKWITLEAETTVKIGDAQPQPLTIKIQTYFGAESNSTPHKRAVKTSDVFIYNGHSYIGYGPLDPSNFSSYDFPPSYQIMFIDGCVSYNYYEADYFPLKEGGSANLELVTNGVEAPSYRSGYALGRFLNGMLWGTLPSYKDLLEAAEDTDPLRVVDGEVDNVYQPAKTPITLTW